MLRAALWSIFPASISTVYIVHCTIRGFTDPGVEVVSTTNPTRVVVKDSIIVNNGFGASVGGAGGATNGAIIVNTVIDGNRNGAAEPAGTNGPASIALIKTLLTGSQNGLALFDGGTADLIGPSNTITGEITGSPTSVPFK